MAAGEAERLTKTYLRPWRRSTNGFHSPIPINTINFNSPIVSSKKVTVHSHFEQAYLMMGVLAPSAADLDQVPMKVLNALFGVGMSSRLFVTLREKLGLAYEVSSFYPTRLDKSQWVIYLGLPKDQLSTAARALDNLLEQMAEHGPTDREVLQAKALIRGGFLMDRQSRRRQVWYRAWWEFLGRRDGYGEEFLERIDAVTPANLKCLMRRLLDQPRVTVTVVPK